MRGIRAARHPALGRQNAEHAGSDGDILPPFRADSHGDGSGDPRQRSPHVSRCENLRVQQLEDLGFRCSKPLFAILDQAGGACAAYSIA